MLLYLERFFHEVDEYYRLSYQEAYDFLFFPALNLLPLRVLYAGPVQPPSQPNFTNNSQISATIDAEEHIEELKRLVASLRAQLEGRSEVHPTSSGSSMASASAVGADLVGRSSAVTTGSDLGSVYAQQRSQKLCLRAGGEGRQVPRYLEMHREPSSTSLPLLAAGRATSIMPAATISSTSSKVLVHGPAGSVSPLSSSLTPSKQSTPPSSEVVKGPSSSSETLHSSIPSIPIAAPPTASSSSSSTGTKTMSGAGVTYTPVAGASLGAAQESVSVKAIVPPKKIMKLVGQAVKEWGMIEEGDRLLLGLSGGKDSLALLHILLALQVFYASYDFFIDI